MLYFMWLSFWKYIFKYLNIDEFKVEMIAATHKT